MNNLPPWNGRDADRVEFQPKNPVTTFTDAYGDEQVIHRPKGRQLKVYKGGNTVVLRMNRAAAVLMGQRIRDRRVALGFTQRELCIKAGFVDVNPKQRIWAIENATRSEGVRMGTLYALAHALGCEPCVLMPSLEDVMRVAGVGTQEVAPLVVK